MASCLSHFDVILVPQGAEYQAVCRGLARSQISPPPVLAIPMGVAATKCYLKQQSNNFLSSSSSKLEKVLLLGLCGSLQPQYSVGDRVLYQHCLYSPNSTREPEVKPLSLPCDRELTAILARGLGDRISEVRGLTRDRLVASAAQKRALGQVYGADTVDMEGFAVLEVLREIGASVAIIRVVSDGSDRDIPDLDSAIAADGTLKPLPLARTLIANPLAALRLIGSSLKALKQLEAISLELTH